MKIFTIIIFLSNEAEEDSNGQKCGMIIIDNIFEIFATSDFAIAFFVARSNALSFRCVTHLYVLTSIEQTKSKRKLPTVI
jgi:hypothetical protein